MRIAILHIILCSVLLWSCDGERIDLGSSSKYLPQQSLLRKGLVWKYYVHIDQKNKARRTIVEYTKFQIKDAQLIKETYDNGLKLLDRTIYSIKNDVWSVEQFQYNTTDELIDASIIKPHQIQWDADRATSKFELEIEGLLYVIESIQQSVVDTIHQGVSKAIFYSDNYFSEYHARDIVEFTEGLGPHYKSRIDENTQQTWLLDEIISASEFDRRRKHDLHRIAYIDPDEGYNPNPEWSTCNQLDLIMDYYKDSNGYARLAGGKGKLRSILSEYLDTSKLNKESGYLTFRFVVNCNGEIGRIITEESDLEFNHKQFSVSCRQHLLDIISTKLSFDPLDYGGTKKDSYLYLTFKLDHGEIIEILP